MKTLQYLPSAICSCPIPFKAVCMSCAMARMTETLSNSTGQALKNLDRHWWSELGKHKALCTVCHWYVIHIHPLCHPWHQITDTFNYSMHSFYCISCCSRCFSDVPVEVPRSLRLRSLAVASAPRLKAPAPNASAKTCQRHKVERCKPYPTVKGWNIPWNSWNIMEYHGISVWFCMCIVFEFQSYVSLQFFEQTER